MLLDPLFSPFLAASPLSVMARSLIEHTLAPTDLDRLFEDHAKKQYTRKVTFSFLVELISLAVCGKQPSVCSVYQTNPGSVAASLTAVYNKRHGIEDSISTLLVEQTAERLSLLVEQVGGLYPESVPGYPMRILDGNHLAGTEHRLPETRDESAAPLPGQTPVEHRGTPWVLRHPRARPSQPAGARQVTSPGPDRPWPGESAEQ